LEWGLSFGANHITVGLFFVEITPQSDGQTDSRQGLPRLAHPTHTKKLQNSNISI